MTVLMREELNAADLAWAAADPAWLPVPVPASPVETGRAEPPRERRVVEPDVLRALGAL